MRTYLKKMAVAAQRRRTVLTLAAVVACLALLVPMYWSQRADASQYTTDVAERGTVEVSVSATGTVQAVRTVQVGSQASGTISWIGVDFNSPVKRGQVIARLDPATIETQVANAQASVESAEAARSAAGTDIESQQANIAAAKANLEVNRAQRDDALALVRRYEDLKNVVAARDIESARAQASAAEARYQQAAAQVKQAEAASAISRARSRQSDASLAQARAQLAQTNVNLSNTVITSPIDGVVVSRDVDVGQTVAASLQAPTLFTIANDLTKMQVLASVDEADVGQVREGINASFTVDAFPNEMFRARVSQVRLNAQALQNVVTYTAVPRRGQPGAAPAARA